MIQFLFILLSVFCIEQCQSNKIVIKTNDDFNNLIQLSKQTPFDQDIELDTDLNMSSFLNFPLGLKGIDDCVPFSGVFDGKGHSIKHLNINNSLAALFCRLDGAVVKNVIFDSSCSFSGDIASAVAVEASGIVIIQRVINRANVIGNGKGAGFVAQSVPNSPILIISFVNCENEGSVLSDGIACGFTCAFSADESMVVNVLIMNSINKDTVVGLVEAFGFCPLIYFAENVVSIGDVRSDYVSFSFWRWSQLTTLYTSSVFAPQSSCKSCFGDSIQYFEKGSKGHYTVLSEGFPLLTTLLNNHAKEMEYGFSWTDKLALKKDKQ